MPERLPRISQTFLPLIFAAASGCFNATSNSRPEISLLGLSGAQSIIAASCAEWKSKVPSASDGTFLLTLAAGQVNVFCYNMATTPLEYLAFARSVSSGFPNSNYTYAASPPAGGWRRSFDRVRFFPDTLQVSITDNTFASDSCTTPPCNNPYHQARYAEAAGCGNEDGTGNVDMIGLPFVVNTSQFAQNGAGPYNCTVTPSSSGQVLNLTGNGGCGWMSPDTGTQRLQLSWGP